MKREQWNTREKRREAERNTNQLAELLKILNHFFPDLRIQLLNVKDPRKKNYTKCIVPCISSSSNFLSSLF